VFSPCGSRTAGEAIDGVSETRRADMGMEKQRKQVAMAPQRIYLISLKGSTPEQ
jgi:hypothetical protein